MKTKNEERASALRLEFYTVNNEPNPSGCPLISWQLRLRENGPVVMRSTERWTTVAKARSDTGLLLQDLFENKFNVYDLTRSAAAKIPAARRKAQALSSKAGKSPAPVRSPQAHKPKPPCQ